MYISKDSMRLCRLIYMGGQYQKYPNESYIGIGCYRKVQPLIPTWESTDSKVGNAGCRYRYQPLHIYY